jgi:hypothetical protein
VIQFQESHQNRDLLAFVSVAVEDDHWVKIRHPFQGDCCLHWHNLHHTSQGLGLTKMSARWVPQFFTKEQKHERVRIRKECFLTTPTHQICHQLTLFLFLKVKEHLAVTSLTQNHFQIILERVTMTITTEEVAAAYRR